MRSYRICLSLPGLFHRGEVGGDNREERGKGCQGTCIKDTWTKPKWGRIEGGRWEWLVGGEW